MGYRDLNVVLSFRVSYSFVVVCILRDLDTSHNHYTIPPDHALAVLALFGLPYHCGWCTRPPRSAVPGHRSPLVPPYARGCVIFSCSASTRCTACGLPLHATWLGTLCHANSKGGSSLGRPLGLSACNGRWGWCSPRHVSALGLDERCL